MGLSVAKIESQARRVKILTGDDELLVDDGELTDGFLNVPLGRSARRGSWLKMKVVGNSVGGAAEIIVSDSLDKKFRKKPTRLPDFEKRTSYKMFREDDKPAFKAV